MSHANIGAYLQQHGHLPEAIEQYETVVRLTDSPHLSAVVDANLGSAYLQSGDGAKAQESFARALQLDPGVPTIWMGMGNLALGQGGVDDAIQDFSHALELQPSAEGYLGLGRALAQANRRPEALAAYQQALKLDPDSAEAQRAVDSLSGNR
jgi:tetratricopeptide (TPR) repeat protein